MRHNRSIPSSTVIPVLSYPDVREAVTWLTASFGFAERVRIGEAHRAQMSVGGAAVIIADTGEGRRAPDPAVRLAQSQCAWPTCRCSATGRPNTAEPS